MACCSHWCEACDHEWFDNKADADNCPRCGSDRVGTSFDEEKD